MKPLPKKLKRPVLAYYAEASLNPIDRIRIIYPDGRVEYTLIAVGVKYIHKKFFRKDCTSRKNLTDALKAIIEYDKVYDPYSRLIHWEYL